MQYKPKSIAGLNIALGGLPDQMRVEVESGIEVRARDVSNKWLASLLLRRCKQRPMGWRDACSRSIPQDYVAGSPPYLAEPAILLTAPDAVEQHRFFERSGCDRLPVHGGSYLLCNTSSAKRATDFIVPYNDP
jgi:hypothetical protein